MAAKKKTAQLDPGKQVSKDDLGDFGTPTTGDAVEFSLHKGESGYVGKRLGGWRVCYRVFCINGGVHVRKGEGGLSGSMPTISLSADMYVDIVKGTPAPIEIYAAGSDSRVRIDFLGFPPTPTPQGPRSDDK